jgi:curved DNA-binding protein
VSIKIPAGTQGGQKLRVRGRGLATRENSRGDLFVVTRIVVPSKITDSEEKLWEQLKRESKFNPRSSWQRT